MPVTLQTTEDAFSLAERALLLSKAVQPSAAKAIATQVIPEHGGVLCAPLNQILTALDGQLANLPPKKRALALLLEFHALQLPQSGTDSARAPVPTTGHLTPALKAALLHEQETQRAAGASTSAAPSPSNNPLVGKSVEDAVAYLISLLSEADGSGVNAGLPEMYRRRLVELGADVVWETYCEAKLVHDNGGEVIADGSRKRSLGGIFLKGISKKRNKAHTGAALKAIEPMPPLRSYQQAAVDEISAAAGTNYILVAPTGSGKTAVAATLAKQLVNAKPTARILMLVPEVVLTNQQAAAFLSCGLRKTTPFSSEHPLNSSNWQQNLMSNNVMIATAQLLVNVLARREQALTELDLLIFDEAHHAMKDHPYALVLRVYNELKGEGVAPLPRILGMTASPAADATMPGTILRVGQLQELLQARFYLVHEQDEEVSRVVPSPTEIEVTVPHRAIDGKVWCSLLVSLIHMLSTISDAVKEAQQDLHQLPPSKERTEYGASLSKMDTALLPLTFTPTTRQSIASMGQQSRDTLVNLVNTGLRCCVEEVRTSMKTAPPELKRCLHLAQELRKGLDIVEDGGFEAAFHFLAAQLYELAERASHSSSSRSGASPATATTPAAAAAAGVLAAEEEEEEEELSSYESCDDEEDDQTGSGNGTGSAAAHPPAAAGGGFGGTGFGAALGAAAGHVGDLLKPGKVLTDAVKQMLAAANNKATAEALGLPWGLSSWELVEELVRESEMGRPELVLQSAEDIQHGSFPRLLALVEYLQKFRDQEVLHGIVFVRRRQVVHYLADALRCCPQLTFIDKVIEFTGHNAGGSSGKGMTLEAAVAGGGGNGSSSGGGALLPGQSAAAERRKGMSGRQQQQAMEQFKVPGRHLLISTSAAEEGVDVPTCSFVVRYNSASSGTQRIQSKGRSRAQVSEFVTLLQDGDVTWGANMGAREAQMHEKSKKEEENMLLYIRAQRAAAAASGSSLV